MWWTIWTSCANAAWTPTRALCRVWKAMTVDLLALMSSSFFRTCHTLLRSLRPSLATRRSQTAPFRLPLVLLGSSSPTFESEPFPEYSVLIFFWCCRDLCTAFGAHLLPLVDTEPITEMLAIGRRSKTTKTKTLSNWATKEIRRLKTPSSSWLV